MYVIALKSTRPRFVAGHSLPSFGDALKSVLLVIVTELPTQLL